MANEESHKKVVLGGLARKLIQLERLKEDSALSITEQALKQSNPFVTQLIMAKSIDPLDLALLCAQEFGLPYFDITAFDFDHIPKEWVKAPIIQKHHAFPLFKRGSHLFIAITDPTNLQALDEIKYQTNMNTEGIIIEEDKFNDAVEKILSAQELSTLGDLGDTDLESLDISSEDSASVTPLGGSEADDAPIVRFVNKVLLDAINIGASDIHFEPYERSCRIRLRQDGILYEHASPPVTLAPRLTARLKIMSRLDISERRVPQDGRFKMKISNARSIDFRVSTCPTLFGEKVVMRILDPGNAKIGVDALGYDAMQKEHFLTALSKPHGMILVTGPTGSGKTISLYTALNLLNTDERNISSCEDPVEINLPGINQVSINPKAGLTFSLALRAFLRQDPDVVMIGEIRDLETAEIAVKAAQTGHLVLSTLHTNSAADTLTRLVNMGIPNYNLATAVTLVIAQRLARKLCQSCKIPLDIPRFSLEQAGFTHLELDAGLVTYGPRGCEKCKNGYKGGVGIFEVMPITPTLSQIIMAGSDSIAIAKQAHTEEVCSIRQAALHKVREGLTSLEEINRVTKD
jgi:type IV pilus assembly protein PilB